MCLHVKQRQVCSGTILTWAECEGLQSARKRRWPPAGFAPVPIGRRPLGKPLGLRCSVEEKAVRGGRGGDTAESGCWTGDLSEGESLVVQQEQRLELWSTWSQECPCLISKVHTLTQLQWRTMAAPLALVSTRVVSATRQRTGGGSANGPVKDQ